jgi:serine/threonine protein kinase
MPINDLSFEDVRQGGQKKVFPIEIEGERFAAKFLEINKTNILKIDAGGSVDEYLDSTTARAEREVGAMSNLDSPHIVKLGMHPLKRVEIKGEHYLFYSEELLHGEDLFDYIINKPEKRLSQEEVLSLAKEICTAISIIWEAGFIHRDIKPKNIFRKDDGTFVLLDLGLALDLADQSLTQPGMIVGTQIWMSPEQFDANGKRNLDFRSDLFSLGAVLHYATTGRHPFAQQGDNSYQVILNILNASPIRVDVIDTSLSTDLADLIFRLLANKPSMRYRTPKRALDAINAVTI